MHDVVRMTMYACLIHIRLLNYITDYPEKEPMGLLQHAEEDVDKERVVLAAEYIDTWACEVKHTCGHADALVVRCIL